MEVWQWVLTICGGISALGGAVAVIVKWTKPLRAHLAQEQEQNERLAALELQDKRDLDHFDDIARELKHTRQANQAVYKALMSMMNHMVDGNSIDHLKAARNELSSFIIDH